MSDKTEEGQLPCLSILIEDDEFEEFPVGTLMSADEGNPNNLVLDEWQQGWDDDEDDQQAGNSEFVRHLREEIAKKLSSPPALQQEATPVSGQQQ